MEQIRKVLKDNARTRWSILFLIAFVQAANYYFYDALSPLKRLMEENFNITSSNYGLLIAAYSIPNTFLLMAVLGGVILDKLGIRRTGFLFVGMMAIGGLITAYGASEYFSNGGFGYALFNSFLQDYSPELKMMVLGRFFFGLGAETSIVVVSKVIVKWFKGKELALAFGMKIGLARAGSALAIFFSAEIAEFATHWTIAIWFAAMLLLIAFLAFLVYSIFDVRIDKQLNEQSPLKKDDGFSFRDLAKLLTNKSFIYVTLLCLTFYSAVFPFQAFSPDFLLNKFGMSLTQSGKIASILYWVTMFATPFFGFVVDRFGKSATLMIFGAILLTLIHLTFAFTYFNPIIPLVLLGIAIALVPAAMWPSVAKIVAEKRIGSAYGAMFSIQNLGLFAFPILAGMILDTTNNNAEVYLTPAEVKQMQASKTITSEYLDRSDEPIPDKELLATVSLFEIHDSIALKSEKKVLRKQLEKHGELVWVENFKTRSGKDGKFRCILGSDTAERINIRNLRIDPETTVIRFSGIEMGLNEVKIDTGSSFYKCILKLREKMRKDIEGQEKITVTLIDTVADSPVLTEEHDIFFDNNDQLILKLGKGRISYVNVDYLNWTENMVVKVRTPLNYTWTILMFAFLGVLGFVFALLLKREDKKAGYGLELPSNVKSQNSE